jgi:DNA (cytosine-5)-methyltransferase 1
MKAISLFSGLGGDSLGLKMGGCDLLAYNELQPVACSSHDANFPETTLISHNSFCDIVKIPDDTISEYSGKYDVLFAGFPCQGFSNAGKKREDDPRNTLFLEFLRFARLTLPTVIIGENVKGLLSRKTSSGRSYIDVITSEFSQLGYNIVYGVLRAHEHGVAQRRERLFIVGVRDNPYGWNARLPEPLTTTIGLQNIVRYSPHGKIRVDSKLFDGIPSECILSDNNDDTTETSPHPYLYSKLHTASKTYAGKTYDVLFSFGKRDSPIHCEIVDIRNPCKTIISTYDHQPRLFVPQKNRNGCYLRPFTPRELKMIQGFPEDYIVCGNIKQQIVQIGNAVPPPVVSRIVKAIIGNDTH